MAAVAAADRLSSGGGEFVVVDWSLFGGGSEVDADGSGGAGLLLALLAAMLLSTSDAKLEKPED